MPAAAEQKNMNLYLSPDHLIANEANEKARPMERPEHRAARVREMAESISENGQEYPVLVIEVDSDGATTYEYVDGGCRVEAIAKLNETLATPLEVWCSLVDPNEDLFKKAVTANLHRTQNSLLDMAYIVTEVRERNSWKGKGGGAKVASYLGIQPSRVTEYEKLLRAAPPVKARIESGEIASLDAALKLMSVPEEDQPRVADRAREIAEADERAKPEPKRKKKLAPVTPEQKAVFQSVKESAKREKEKKAEDAAQKKATPVKAKHVQEAAREITGKGGPRAKSAISEFFEAVTEAAYPPAAVKFADYFVQTWMVGEGTDRRARDLFDLAVHVGSAKPKPKAAAKTAPAPKAKKMAKPSAKPKAKGKK